MLTINVTLSTLHVAIVGRLIEINADPAKVLSEVNAQLTALEVNADKSSASIAFMSSKGGAKEGPKMTVKSVDKRTSVKVAPTAALRLAEINEYLNESAELYTRVNSVTLPQSVETWASAERFALPEGEKEKMLAALVKS